jgi:hypothetical protein
MARQTAHRNADGGIACDLGIGEALRRQSKLARAEIHFERASAVALEHGQSAGWIRAQLGLAEIARERGDDASEIAERIRTVCRHLLLAEHPWLRLRAFVLGSLSARGPEVERLLDRAEDELPRFQRRSCDLEIERQLVDDCRRAVHDGEPIPPIELDVL